MLLDARLKLHLAVHSGFAPGCPILRAFGANFCYIEYRLYMHGAVFRNHALMKGDYYHGGSGKESRINA